ncbi:MAG: hypothetical protein K6B28_05415 [Lachnospiraceae bacterium]|nr:hypothetical protein [Lachnospiraceae bacterium]
MKKTGKNKLILILLLMCICPLLMGADLFESELLTDGKLLDLDLFLKDVRIGGGDTDEAVDDTDKEEDSDKEEAKDNKEEEAKENIEDGGGYESEVKKEKIILIEGKNIYIDKFRCKDMTVLENRLKGATNDAGNVILDIEYADYKTVIEVRHKLEEMNIGYSLNESGK